MSTDLVLETLLELKGRGIPCATATIVSSSGSIPNEVGAKMLINGDGELLAGTIGGGGIEKQVIEQTTVAIAQGKSTSTSASLTPKEAGGIGMMCGGRVEVFIEVHRSDPSLILVGAGHINLCLGRLAHGLGFRVVVIDDRAQWANAENYPNAEIFCGDPSKMLPQCPVDSRSFIVIGTRDGDADALVAAASTEARYIGMVASRRKAIEVLKEIQHQVSLPPLLARLYSPIGLRLGGRSPEAIALSILAEIQSLVHSSEPATRNPISMSLSPEKFLSYLEKKAPPS